MADKITEKNFEFLNPTTERAKWSLERLKKMNKESKKHLKAINFEGDQKMAEKDWQRIRFICSECGNESWTEFDVNSYVLKVDDLVCDDCLPEEEF